MTRRPSLRAMTLIEVMTVATVGAVIAAATTVNVVEQVRRVRSVDAAKSALHPHMVARDRAAAARTCTETILVPALPAAFTPPTENAPVQWPATAQRNVARVAVIEWTTCDTTALINRIDFFDLDGDITLTPYSSADARAVFGPTGGLTDDRPVTGGGGGIFVCLGGGGGGGGGPPKPGGGGGGGGGACTPPPPPAPPPDILFAATTYFGAAENYRIAARAGSSQGSATDQAVSPF